MPQTAETLSPRLSDNLRFFRLAFQNAADFLCREMDLNGTRAALLALDGLADKQALTLGVLRPLLAAPLPRHSGEKLRIIEETVLATVEQKRESGLDQLLTLLMSGFAVLCVDGCAQALVFGVQGFDLRSPEEPQNEVMQRGANDGFTESFQNNMAMIRRRLKTADLKFEQLSLGTVSRTPAVLCYLQGTVQPALLERLRTKLAAVDLPSVLGAGYLVSYLERGRLFSGVGATERPDVVCGKLLEGRAAILIDGTPSALLVPFLFVEHFQTLDDYLCQPVFAAFVRWIKALAFGLSALLPGFYTAIATHHPELLPESLMLKIAQSEAETPFPVLAETLLLYFLYEVLREAGLRAPRSLGTTVSIVGGLVIGDTAVSAGLVSAPSLLVVALTAIAGYTVPRLYDPLSLLRLGFLLAGGLFGVFGVMCGCALLLFELCGTESFGVPLLAPLAPFSARLALRDVLARRTWRALARRRVTVADMPGAKGEGSHES